VSQERATRTRRGIVVAAAELFDELGYEGASTAGILARGGVTRGALYFHFPSKATLADAVVAAQDADLALPDTPVRLQAALDVCRDHVRRLKSDVLLRAALRLATERSSYRPAADPQATLRRALERLFTEAAARGELLPTVEPRELTGVVLATLTGLRLLRECAGAPSASASMATIWRYLLPSVAMPGVLTHLVVTADDDVK
jgi:AcrR family transcriptional regulator